MWRYWEKQKIWFLSCHLLGRCPSLPIRHQAQTESKTWQLTSNLQPADASSANANLPEHNRTVNKEKQTCRSRPAADVLGMSWRGKSGPGWTQPSVIWISWLDHPRTSTYDDPVIQIWAGSFSCTSEHFLRLIPQPKYSEQPINRNVQKSYWRVL